MVIQKLASSASNAASLAIVVAGVFAASPMAFAQCAFQWGTNPVYFSPGPFISQGILTIGGLGGPNFNMGYSQPPGGNFTIQSLGVSNSYFPKSWPTQGVVQLPLSTSQVVTVGGVVPSNAMNGQSAKVTMSVSSGFTTQCSYTATVVVQGMPASQTITFGALSSQTIETAPFTVTATASSGLTVSFASTTPTICTVSPGAMVTLAAVGTCTIQATQAGNTNYAAATPVNHSFQVYPVCSGSAALIQSNYGGGTQGNFEVVFPNDELSSAGQTPFDSFASQKELVELGKAWPAERLVAIWNSLPGVTPALKFKNSNAAASRIWARIQGLGEAAQPEAQPAKPKPEKKAKGRAQSAKGAPAMGKAGKKTPAPKNAPKGKKAAEEPKAKVARKSGESGEPKAARTGTKSEEVIAMLKRKGGAALAEIMAHTGWQKHTTRGWVSGFLGKKMGIAVESFKSDKGDRTYRIK